MAFARKTDPQTSHEAADSVIEVTDTQYKIWSLLRKPMTDRDLVAEFNEWVAAGFADMASESGIRTRRSELVAAGKVVDTGRREVLPTKRKAIVWQTAEELA